MGWCRGIRRHCLDRFSAEHQREVNRTVAVTNDTADLVEQGVDEVNQLQQDVSDLTEQVANLTDALKADGTDSTQNQARTPAMWIPA